MSTKNVKLVWAWLCWLQEIDFEYKLYTCQTRLINLRLSDFCITCLIFLIYIFSSGRDLMNIILGCVWKKRKKKWMDGGCNSVNSGARPLISSESWSAWDFSSLSNFSRGGADWFARMKNAKKMVRRLGCNSVNSWRHSLISSESWSPWVSLSLSNFSRGGADWFARTKCWVILAGYKKWSFWFISGLSNPSHNFFLAMMLNYKKSAVKIYLVWKVCKSSTIDLPKVWEIAKTESKIHR